MTEKSKASYDRTTLVGKWFGKHTNDEGQEVLEICELFSNGEFELSFVNEQAEDAHQQTIERGLWGLCNDIHFTITLIQEIDEKSYQADTELAENYHAYKVLRLDGQVFEYQHVESKETFSLIRVEDPIDNISQH